MVHSFLYEWYPLVHGTWWVGAPPSSLYWIGPVGIPWLYGVSLVQIASAYTYFRSSRTMSDFSKELYVGCLLSSHLNDASKSSAEDLLAMIGRWNRSCRYRWANLAYRFWPDAVRYGNPYDCAWRLGSQYALFLKLAQNIHHFYILQPQFTRSVIFEGIFFSADGSKILAAHTSSADFVTSIRSPKRKWAPSRSGLVLFSFHNCSSFSSSFTVGTLGSFYMQQEYITCWITKEMDPYWLSFACKSLFNSFRCINKLQKVRSCQQVFNTFQEYNLCMQTKA